MEKKIKKHYLSILILFLANILIFLTSLSNMFPNNYFYAGWDFVYPLNLPKYIYDLSFAWFSNNSIGYFNLSPTYTLYYIIIFFISSLLQLNFSQQSSIYIALFLFGSFWSMYLSISLFDLHRNISCFYKTVFALLYTYNSYTVYVFYYQNGFTPFLYLYVLFPLFLSLVYRYFEERDNIKHWLFLVLLILLSFFTNITNGNFPFFLSMNLLIAVYIGINFLYIRKSFFIKKAIIFYIFYLASVSWSILPQLFELFNSYTSLNTTSLNTLENWVLSHAAPFPVPFLMVPPFKLYYFSINNPYWIIASYSWIIVFFVSLITMIRNRLNISLMLLYVVCIFLYNKGAGILPENITWFIFKNPLLISIRSLDKSLIFLPSITLIIIALTNVGRMSTLKFKIIITLLVVSQILLSYPLWSGKIQKQYSFLHNFKANENYQTAPYSSLHQLPSEYRIVSDEVNKDPDDAKILFIPYSVLIPNYADYPKWKLIASDPTLQLFNKSVITMNAPVGSFINWNYGNLWNSQSASESAWLIPFSSLLNVKYFVYHKDVKIEFLKQTIDKVKYYEDMGLFTKRFSGDYIDLFEIKNKFRNGHIYIPENIISSNLSLSDLPKVIKSSNLYNKNAIFFSDQNIGKINIIQQVTDKKYDLPEISFKKINQTKYRLMIHEATGRFPLIFSEGFHEGWNIYLTDLNKIELKQMSTAIKKKGAIQNDNLPQGFFFETWLKKPIDDNKTHLVANGYANSWLIDTNKLCFRQSKCIHNENGSYDFEVIVEFWPQRLLYIGFIISMSTLICGLVYLMVIYCRRIGAHVLDKENKM